MRIFLLTFLFCLLTASLFAQDEAIKRLRIESTRVVPNKDPNDTTHKAWRKGGVYGINVSQGTLNNWAAGGENFSLSVNSQFSLYAFFKKGKQSWDNTFDMNIGYVNTTSIGGIPRGASGSQWPVAPAPGRPARPPSTDAIPPRAADQRGETAVGDRRG